jgi:hypothetical protein
VSSSTGMAGLAVTAVVSALVAFGVAALLGPAAAPPPSSSASSPDSTDSLRREIERLRREVQELRASRAPAAVPGAAPPAAAAPSAPDEAPVPATRAELRTFVDERVAERLAAGLVPGANSQVFTAPVRKTIDEAGAELGLSSVDIDSVKRIWRESEMEALALIMGTPDIEAVKEEVKAAEEDPDKKAALINKVVGNMVRNLGKVATIEDRRNRELKKFLTDEQVKKLKGMNVKPTLEDEGLENILKGTFGN